MNKRFLIVAATVLALVLAGCNTNGEWSYEMPGDSAASGTSRSSEVEEANKTAAEMKIRFEKFLDDAEAEGCGIKGGKDEIIYVGLNSEDGVWSCFSNLYDDTDGALGWCGGAEGITADTPTSAANSAEKLLCIEFAKEFGRLKNSTSTFIVLNGECTGVAYSGISHREFVGDFQMFDPVDFGGNFPEAYRWSGGEAGVLTDKETGKTVILGTAPVVGMDDTFILHEEEDANTYAYRNAAAVYKTINDFFQNKPDSVKINDLDEPRTIHIEISYGRYSVNVDEGLVPLDSLGKFVFRLRDTIDDAYDFSHGWINAYIVNGECKGVVFMSAAGYERTYPLYEDFERGSFRWDSAGEIGSKDGVTMGVYPELSYSE